MHKAISIIIATYNAAAYLETCLNSIIPQLDDNTELIVIDGGSKDDTVEIIKRYQSYISYWISEQDKGIYDAWNKGIGIALGDWIMFIGADDKLMAGALDSYRGVIVAKSDVALVDFISSRVQMVDLNGKLIRIIGRPFLWPQFLKEMTVAHPGALHSKKMFLKYGKYNTDYKIVGDYEFLLRGGESLKTIYVDKVTVVMSEGGASDSVAAIREHYKAVTKTANYSKIRAFMNFFIVFVKFKVKKKGRKLGLNLYLRRG